MQTQLAELVKNINIITNTKKVYSEKNYYDIISYQYDSNYIDPISQAENIIIKEMMLSNLIKNTWLNILDIWCWTWLIYELLEDNISNYIWVDISEWMLKQFKNKFTWENIKLFQNDINEIDLELIEDNSIDLIVSTFWSFSYMHNPDEFIKKARKKLTSNWIFFLMTYSQFSTKNIYYSCHNKDFCALNKYRPYNFRNDSIDILWPSAYFYNQNDIKDLASKWWFNKEKILWLNYFIDFQKDSFKTWQDAKNALLNETKIYNNIDLAHSLILILNNNEWLF